MKKKPRILKRFGFLTRAVDKRPWVVAAFPNPVEARRQQRMALAKGHLCGDVRAIPLPLPEEDGEK